MIDFGDGVRIHPDRIDEGYEILRQKEEAARRAKELAERHERRKLAAMHGGEMPKRLRRRK